MMVPEAILILTILRNIAQTKYGLIAFLEFWHFVLKLELFLFLFFSRLSFCYFCNMLAFTIFPLNFKLHSIIE